MALVSGSRQRRYCQANLPRLHYDARARIFCARFTAVLLSPAIPTKRQLVDLALYQEELPNDSARCLRNPCGFSWSIYSKDSYEENQGTWLDFCLEGESNIALQHFPPVLQLMKKYSTVRVTHVQGCAFKTSPFQEHAKLRS